MEVLTLLRSLRIELGLEIIAGHEGLNRTVTGSTIQKPGLALAGFTEMLKPGLIQILGYTEIEYLWSLEPEQRKKATELLIHFTPPLVVVTQGADIPDQLIQSANNQRVPLLSTGLSTSLLVEALHKFLANRLAQIRSIHGVLVDVFGVGILIIGKSGIGKSECALELIMRGHRLVADDIVDVNLVPPSTIVGAGNILIRHHMEIRGLGIINIKDLFGIAAIRETKQIKLVICMEEWNQSKSYDRLGISAETHDILGIAVPKLDIPVRLGRSLTSIIEVAARNQLLKVMGHHSAIEFQTKLDSNLSENLDKLDKTDEMPHSFSQKVIEYDFE